MTLILQPKSGHPLEIKDAQVLSFESCPQCSEDGDVLWTLYKVRVSVDSGSSPIDKKSD